MRVLFLGDSLTRGSIGYSFADFLPSDIHVINKGVNGDTTRGARDRLMRYITTIDCDSVVVCIGANDVLLPAMGEAVWKKHCADGAATYGDERDRSQSD